MSKTIQHAGINLEQAEKSVDLLRMAMEADDIAGIFAYVYSIEKSMITIKNWTRTIYGTTGVVTEEEE